MKLARVIGPLYFVQGRFSPGRKWRLTFDGEVFREHLSVASAKKEADALDKMLKQKP